MAFFFRRMVWYRLQYRILSSFTAICALLAANSIARVIPKQGGARGELGERILAPPQGGGDGVTRGTIQRWHSLLRGQGSHKGAMHGACDHGL